MCCFKCTLDQALELLKIPQWFPIEHQIKCEILTTIYRALLTFQWPTSRPCLLLLSFHAFLLLLSYLGSCPLLDSPLMFSFFSETLQPTTGPQTHNHTHTDALYDWLFSYLILHISAENQGGTF